MNWAAADVASATGAELLQSGPASFPAVSTDTRSVGRGDLFVALRGDRYDAHDFIGQALAAGARGFVVERDLPTRAPGAAWFRVNETLRAYGDLAAHRRRRLDGRLVAITGSNGKTTTKEMLASVLAASGAVVASTRGNENNLVGLPRTLLRLGGDEAFVVLEMGMNRPGEIARLTEIAAPEIGVLTCIAPAHLEGLGSIEAVARAKGELAAGLGERATLVINADDERLEAIAADFSGRVLRAAVDRDADVRVLEHRSLAGGRQGLRLRIVGAEFEVELPLPGRHNATNAALAATVGIALGVDPTSIARGLADFQPPPMRMERMVIADGVVVWNDAYNANPASTAAALETLRAEPATRRIAVVGEMAELGEASLSLHRATGRIAAESKLDLLVTVGALGGEIAAGAREAGMDADAVREVASAGEVELKAELREGDVVLVKGSRAAGMEAVVAGLRGVEPAAGQS